MVPAQVLAALAATAERAAMVLQTVTEQTIKVKLVAAVAWLERLPSTQMYVPMVAVAVVLVLAALPNRLI